MAESSLRSYVAGKALMLIERAPLAQVNVRGDPRDERFAGAIRQCLGVALPESNGSAAANGATLLWLGPD